MAHAATVCPAADEFAPYYGNYIAQVADGDIRAALRAQGESVLATFRTVPEARGDHAYGPGKWTLKESLLHMIDAERVFAYRMLRVARPSRAAPRPRRGGSISICCRSRGRRASAPRAARKSRASNVRVGWG